ncbi:hypothetical protein [Streptomyces sp. ITFR-16]|uniref:hypothetical protein n=1 Tax=Streptomyces sp. ITFR-16 TaxID=3075198 RepID=UPI002889A3B0|nr:hypothetical protein [Streptomyces sp. ITFR-16]WNI24402.1 hypothetical protein RLT58_21970 [Streptomyces sp. ITFR-16]
MAEVDELLEGVAVRLPAAEEIRAKGQRRRTRSRAVRVAAGGAAVLVAAGAWALLPPGHPEARQTVATATENPFRTDGVIRTREPDELPGYARWHWRTTGGERPEAAGQPGGPLPQVGLDQACPGSFAQGNPPDQKRYSLLYTGRDDALAQHRIIEYDDAATARAQVAELGDAMTACGLRPASATAQERREGAAAWSGTVKDGRPMRVTVRRWTSWVSVVEILDGKAAG